MESARIIRIEHAWASAEREIVEAVRRLDPSWGSTTFTVADGWAVLAGPGLFANALFGVGLTADVTDADFDHLEEHAAEVGVPPALEISEATRPEVAALAAARGYRPDDVAHAVVHDLHHLPRLDPDFVIERVPLDEVAHWQDATAEGWGHDEPRRRAASDVYSAAAAEIDRPGLLLARAADDGRVVGAAMLRIADGFATLGGMSTLPAERGRGVQAALVLHRLQAAAGAGCDFAASMAVAGSASERNLLRLGFQPSHTKTEWVGP